MFNGDIVWSVADTLDSGDNYYSIQKINAILVNRVSLLENAHSREWLNKLKGASIPEWCQSDWRS